MRKFKFTLGISSNKVGHNREVIYDVELPEHYTDEDIENEFNIYLSMHAENHGFDGDNPTMSLYGGWEEVGEGCDK